MSAIQQMILGTGKVLAGTIDLDDFNDSSQSSVWAKTAYSGFNSGVTVVESGGVLTITPLSSTAGTNRNGYQSVSTYNFTGKFIKIKLVQKTGSSAPTDVRFGLTLDSTNVIQFIADATPTLIFRTLVANVASDTSTSYSASSHLWLKISESGGNIIFETSPDNVTWTTQRTVANPFAVTALKPHFFAGTSGSVATPGTAIFDDFSSNL